MSGFHKDAGAVAAEMHGIYAAPPHADAATRLLYNVQASDVSQGRAYKQSDTGQLWIPDTTGVSATWRELLTDMSPTFLSVANFGSSFWGFETPDKVVATADGTVFTTAPIAYRNLSWASGSTGKIIFAGFPIFVNGTLDTTNMSSSGYIGHIAQAGGNSAVTTAGAAGAATTFADGTNCGVGGAGSAGAVGGTVAGAQGAATVAVKPGFGGGGGQGSAGGTGNGGANAGGVLRAGAAVQGSSTIIVPPFDGLWSGAIAGATYARQIAFGGAGGAGGGSGGGDGTAGGGGGGGGAGCNVGVIFCKKLILGPSGVFWMTGGAGGNGGTPAGGNRGGGAGGGGGGGGCLVIVAGEVIGSATNFASCNGGAPGAAGTLTGTGGAPSASFGGTAGRVVVFDLKNGVRKSTTTAVGGTAGAAETLQLSWP